MRMKHNVRKPGAGYLFAMPRCLNKVLALLLLIAIGYLTGIATGLPTVFATDPESSGGGSVVNYFAFKKPSTEIRAVMTPTKDADGHHFYALSVRFTDTVGNDQYQDSAYAGLQTENFTNGQSLGRAFIFSLWGAETGYPAEGVVATPFSGEGEGYSLRKPYDWQADRSYEIVIRRSSFDSATESYRWQAEITDSETGETSSIGEISSPQDQNYIHGTDGSLFHERYGPAGPVCRSDPPPEQAGVEFSDLRVNSHTETAPTQTIEFISSATNGIFANADCQDFITSSQTTSQAQSSFTIPVDIAGYLQFPATEDGRRSIPENTAAGIEIGRPVAIKNVAGLNYSIGGFNGDSFAINASTGQLLTKAPLDHESKDTYVLTVFVDNGETTGSTAVIVAVSNVDEPSVAPVVALQPGAGHINGVQVNDNDEEEMEEEIQDSDSATLAEQAASKFKDVAVRDYYAPAIGWMLEYGITTDCATDSFCPQKDIARQEFIAFLWQAAGSPEPTVFGSSIFSDVSEDSYADSAIGWAAEKGITVGCRQAIEETPAEFCPTNIVSRGQIATFLYRYVGATHEIADSGFEDVDDDAYYALSVAWMALHKITTGCFTDAFCPRDPATRAHAATFIYRVALARLLGPE